VHLAHERYEVVFAEGEDFDVANDNELVVVFVKDGTVDQVTDVFFIAFGEVHESFGVAKGCFGQTLTVGIFT